MDVRTYDHILESVLFMWIRITCDHVISKDYVFTVEPLIKWAVKVILGSHRSRPETEINQTLIKPASLHHVLVEYLLLLLSQENYDHHFETN